MKIKESLPGVPLRLALASWTEFLGKVFDACCHMGGRFHRHITMAAGDGGVAAAEHLIWVLGQQETVEAAASAADDADDAHLHFLVHSVEVWTRYFAILRWGSPLQ